MRLPFIAAAVSLGSIAALAVSMAAVATPAPGRSPEHLAELLSSLGESPTPDALAALDREAGQKDAAKSGLFWYTDLNEARAAATASGKPILSLRLLGRLDEELSCANSRFFRKTLYVDPSVIDLLKRRFVLHWESVRPVPLVTIDYGNGTKVTRTLTGNSIHYLLAPNGRLIDGLPGLIDAPTFARELTAFADLVQGGPKLGNAQVAAYYDDRLRVIAQSPAAAPVARLELRPADLAMSRTAAKSMVQTAVLKSVRNPSTYVMQDTLRNQRELRPRLIEWLRASPSPDLKTFNARVYAELFATPLNDPLMGLDLPDEAAIVATPLAPR